MKKEEDIIKLFAGTDFDTQGKAQAKVYAQINKEPKRRFKFAFAIAAVSAVIAAFAFWPQTEEAMPPAASQAVSEAECLDLNARYWLEQAASHEEVVLAKCPKEMQVSTSDKVFINEMQHRMKNNFNKLSPAEREKLDDCGEKFKYKVRPVMVYRAEC